MNKSRPFLKPSLVRSFNSSHLSDPFESLVSSSLCFFEEVDSPTSLALWLMLKHKEYIQYTSYSMNPLSYNNPYKFKLDYQCAKMFSKAEFFPNVIDTKKEAMKKFIDCEMKCKSVNDDIIHNGFSSRLGTSAVNNIIHIAMRKISDCLGDAPSLHDLHCHFGPGLNVGLHNDETSLFHKLTRRPSVTKRLSAKLISSHLSTHPAWESIHHKGDIPSAPFSLLSFGEEVPGSRLSFVPKTVKTDRPICVEPLLNSYYQSGIGTAIRNKLRRVGCDLRDQTRNQKFAREGSLTNEIATVDLSSASDTISYMVVLNLVPLDWFELFDITRSPSFTYEGKEYPLEKISSMGNGFTFELESLIFLMLARAVCSFLKLDMASVNTYGDDIILPSSGYELLTSCLAALGFEVNEEKSFHNGPFRESCGADYYLGSQVRPLFLKSYPTPASLMMWCNQLRRMDSGQPDPIYYNWWKALKLLVPKGYYKLEGPDGQGDGHFVVANAEYGYNRMHSKRKSGHEGVGFYTIRQKPIPKRVAGNANYAIALYNAQNPSTLATGKPQNESWDLSVTLRGKTRSYLTRSFSNWKDVYAW